MSLPFGRSFLAAAGVCCMRRSAPLISTSSFAIAVLSLTASLSFASSCRPRNLRTRRSCYTFEHGGVHQGATNTIVLDKWSSWCHTSRGCLYNTALLLRSSACGFPLHTVILSISNAAHLSLGLLGICKLLRGITPPADLLLRCRHLSSQLLHLHLGLRASCIIRKARNQV